MLLYISSCIFRGNIYSGYHNHREVLDWANSSLLCFMGIIRVDFTQDGWFGSQVWFFAEFVSTFTVLYNFIRWKSCDNKKLVTTCLKTEYCFSFNFLDHHCSQTLNSSSGFVVCWKHTLSRHTHMHTQMVLWQDEAWRCWETAPDELKPVWFIPCARQPK